MGRGRGGRVRWGLAREGGMRGDGFVRTVWFFGELLILNIPGDDQIFNNIFDVRKKVLGKNVRCNDTAIKAERKTNILGGFPIIYYRRITLTIRSTNICKYLEIHISKMVSVKIYIALESSAVTTQLSSF